MLLYSVDSWMARIVGGRDPPLSPTLHSTQPRGSNRIPRAGSLRHGRVSQQPTRCGFPRLLLFPQVACVTVLDPCKFRRYSHYGRRSYQSNAGYYLYSRIPCLHHTNLTQTPVEAFRTGRSSPDLSGVWHSFTRCLALACHPSNILCP